MQICNDCKIEKSLDHYGKNSRKKNGKSSRCRECSRIRSSKWRASNLDQAKENHIIWKNNNPEYYSKYNKEYNKKPETIERRKAWFKEEYNKNTEKYLNKSKENRVKYFDYYKKYNREYRLKDPGRASAKSRKYACKKSQAMLSWLTSDHLNEIESFYRQASELTKETGIKHQVDHIIPLQGKNICGLHVPWNLQVLTAKENRKKSNK